MSMRFGLAAVFALLTSIAFAQHAVPLRAEGVAAAEGAGAAAMPAAQPASETAPAHQPAQAVAAPLTANVKMNVPSEMDVYVVQTATREVCRTMTYGDGDIWKECRSEPIVEREPDPALRGVCITRYGERTCY